MKDIICKNYVLDSINRVLSLLFMEYFMIWKIENVKV